MAMPLYIREISLETHWPDHLSQLICGPQSEKHKEIGLEEIIAYICHVALLEIGLVPTFLEVDPQFIPQLPECERIRTVCTPIPANLRNSDSGVFTISYRAVQEILPTPEEEPGENQGRNPPQFVYSKPASVIMMCESPSVSLYGTVPKENAVPASINLQINSHEFLHTRLEQGSLRAKTILNEKLTGQDWIKILQLRGSPLSELVKTRFGLHLLNLMDGLSFEAGLLDLPPEVLFRILLYLPTPTIIKMTRVCWCLYSNTGSKFFWLALIDRDYPKHSKEVREKLAALSEEAAKQDDAPTAYSEYRRLYSLTQPRRFTSYRQMDIRNMLLPNPRNNRSMFLFRFHN